MNQDQFSRLLVRYIVGFTSALLLSVGSYVVVTERLMPTAHGAMAVVLLFAAVQLAVQLVCFLHLKVTGRSRDRTLTLVYTMLMMFVIVIGSLWIMKNLDYRMGMSSEAMTEYMKRQNKKGF